MPRRAETIGNREARLRRTIQRRRRQANPPMVINPDRRSEQQDRRLSFTDLSNNRRTHVDSNGLRNTIRVGAIRSADATLMNAMKKGKVPKSVRSLLLLALIHPQTRTTQAAMNAARYLQDEIDKHKSKSK